MKFSKLDRFLVSDSVFTLWPNTSSKTLDRDLSDHCPIILRNNSLDFGPKPIRVFDAWLNLKDIDTVIERAWSIPITGNRPDCIFRNKLKNVKIELKKHSTQLDNIDSQIRGHLSECNNWEQIAETRQLIESEKQKWLEEKMQYITKEKKKTNMLKQKSRIKWALEGDENSKYFHNYIKRRTSKNNIHGLSINGTWSEDPILIKQEAYSYFNNLFQSKHLHEECPFDNVPHLDYITPLDNQLLEAKFCEKEIWEAISNCDSSKAPGPDGFNMKFFKKHWELIKYDLIKSLDWFWVNSEISKGCNASFFTLIPKKSNPMGLNEYRPICLIGSYYKILTKILSNRLAKVIHKVIGSEQTAFLKGRNILDSAFDCIEWDFLFNTMHHMGFGPKWISFIRACLSSSSISILINGSPTSEFVPERGIRQGDPISPFLFIIVAEGLNILTKRALSNGHLQGLKIGHDNLVITHLQYADDTIFFGEWNKRNAKYISKLLKCFENISGLKVNFRKSKLYGIGTSTFETEQMANYINCTAGSTPFTYLGLPIGVPTSHTSSWQPIVEKFDKRLSDWAAKSVSFGGRLTIIKSILSSIPLYYFSLFHAPATILKVLESKRRKFFWGGSSNDNKINWIKWDQIILPYEKGGLNVGSLLAKNISLLCKWWWRFKNEHNALWVKIIKSIYGPGGGLDTNVLCRNISGHTIWKEIIKSGKVADKLGTFFTSSISKCIGNGTSISFWHDIWIGSETLKTTFHRLYMLESQKDATVAERISNVNSNSMGIWDWSRAPSGRALDELTELTNLISTVSISDRPDSWKFTLDASGIFTTSSLSNLINTLKYGVHSRNLSLPHNKYVPQKVFIFIWRVFQLKIPVRSELDKKGIDLHTILCPLCDHQIETIDHALINCPNVSSIWAQLLDWWNQNNTTISDINGAIISDQGFSHNSVGSFLWQATKLIACYIIWKHRNLKVFSNKIWNPVMIISEIQSQSFSWISTRSRKKNPIEWHQWLLNPSFYVAPPPNRMGIG
ncbi:uncharacterized protein [Rutidosis leptorrhynchoides]|uniref:uncharacterized protein n=1 Tax=Rutidosis leptorrhynchoides TaxID=125765 RepID=UPI003A99A600